VGKNNDRYGEYLCSRGYNVISSDVTWYNVRPFLYQSAQYLNAIPENPDWVFRKSHSFACRWFDDNGTTGQKFLLYLCNPPYGLEKLSKKARNQTRRGLENFQIIRSLPNEINFSEFHDVYIENISRLKLIRSSSKREQAWKSWWKTICEIDGIKLWGAWKEDKLAAFLVTIPKGEGIEIVLERSKTDYLNLYPNNALIYVVTKTLLEDGFHWISFGLENYWLGSKNDTLTHFKLGMGYHPYTVRERYTINPYLSWLIAEDQVHTFIKYIRRIRNRNT
jgi:hypothetical protein